jgi:threonyl-tRNA synthetase
MNQSKNQSKIEIIRHSCAHILAAAVLEMFPEAKFGMGPAIENGFYYDFDLPRTLIPEDLPILEKKMKKIIKRNYPFDKEEITANEAIKLFKKAKQDYKVELIKDLIKEDKKKNAKVKIYKTGNFVDLCKGPHLDSSGEINPNALKLTKIAGAYWKGDEKNKMLQRIYGIAFENEKELKDYFYKLEEAEKRDHRKLGKKLDLFSFHPEAPGMPFWHHKGLIIFNTLVNHWQKIQTKHGYQEVKLPNLLDINLWKQSGHYEHYKNDMFFTENDGKKMALRPMDCPGTILLYKEKLHSYNDFPLRIGELGVVFRNEKSGELHGLLRVQQVTQDDAHIFITKDMIESEVTAVLKIMEELYKPFTMKRKVYLSTRPDDAMGDKKIWDKAEKALRNALEKNKIKYGIKEKDGAFYGPKIDIQIDDSLGRTWQTGTIQLDFFMPERFDIEYTDKKGKKKKPVIIHRALMGSLERFIGVLIEHYAGALPLWLSPVQVQIIPIGASHKKYAEEINKLLEENGLRTEIKDENETVSKKIREGEIQKIPYLLIIGDKEQKSKSVSVRERRKGDTGKMKLDKFVGKIIKEIEKKK